MKAFSFMVLGILAGGMSFADQYLCERLDDGDNTDTYSIDKRNFVELTIEAPGAAKTTANVSISTGPMWSC